jgi:hypothetical protein
MNKPALFLALVLAVLTAPALADGAAQAVAVQTGPQLGECAIFREGGTGRVFKAPTYWVKGSISSVSREQRTAGRCPQIAKSVAAYTRDDWVRIAAATPCVQTDAEVREVDVLRIRLSVDEWETPWSHQHGSVGWLFRGYFLDTPLKKGEVIDMDASWLERCELNK